MAETIESAHGEMAVLHAFEVLYLAFKGRPHDWWESSKLMSQAIGGQGTLAERADMLALLSKGGALSDP